MAEILCEIIPCAERVRFLKTGGEAVAACFKIARNATGRKRIVQSGYNGWINSLSAGEGFQPSGIAAGSPTKGVPPELSALHVSLPWGELDKWEKTFEEFGDEIAAVSISANYPAMEEGHEFLPKIRELTDRYGSLLIFDEIVTGFRLALAGAQEYFGVTPDLAVFAKGMANGMPVSAYLGKADLIDSCKAISISSTFGGETLSLAAVKAVIDFYRKNNVIDYLWKTAGDMWKRAGEMFESVGLPVRFKGVPVCPIFEFEEGLERDDFMKAGYRNGLLLYNVPYTNFSHRAEDVEETLRRLERAAKELVATVSAE